MIAKTLDAGKSWYNVMYEAKNYFPNSIDCISPTHCIAVGEEENEKALTFGSLKMEKHFSVPFT